MEIGATPSSNELRGGGGLLREGSGHTHKINAWAAWGLGGHCSKGAGRDEARESGAGLTERGRGKLPGGDPGRQESLLPCGARAVAYRGARLAQSPSGQLEGRRGLRRGPHRGSPRFGLSGQLEGRWGARLCPCGRGMKHMGGPLRVWARGGHAWSWEHGQCTWLRGCASCSYVHCLYSQSGRPCIAKQQSFTH